MVFDLLNAGVGHRRFPGILGDAPAQLALRAKIIGIPRFRNAYNHEKAVVGFEESEGSGRCSDASPADGNSQPIAGTYIDVCASCHIDAEDCIDVSALSLFPQKTPFPAVLIGLEANENRLIVLCKRNDLERARPFSVRKDQNLAGPSPGFLLDMYVQFFKLRFQVLCRARFRSRRL